MVKPAISAYNLGNAVIETTPNGTVDVPVGIGCGGSGQVVIGSRSAGFRATATFHGPATDEVVLGFDASAVESGNASAVFTVENGTLLNATLFESQSGAPALGTYDITLFDREGLEVDVGVLSVQERVETPTATPSPTATPTASPTATPTETATPAEKLTDVATVDPTPSPTETPTATAQPGFGMLAMLGALLALLRR